MRKSIITRLQLGLYPSSVPATNLSSTQSRLLNEKLNWKKLTIQITSVPAIMLVSAFWIEFFDTMRSEAPLLYPDVEKISWICDHHSQEELINAFQAGTIFDQDPSGC